MESFSLFIKDTLKQLKECNFTQVYPTYNISEKIPILNIDKNGYPNFEIDKVFNGFDLNINNYISETSENNFENIELLILQSNKSFNLLEILLTMANLEMSEEPEIDSDLYYVIQDFKYVVQMDDGSYAFMDSLNNDDNIQNEFTDSYETIFYDNDENFIDDPNYNIDDIDNDTKYINSYNNKNNNNNGFFGTFPEFKTKNATMIVKLNG